MAATMGHYSHVHGGSGNTSRVAGGRRLRLMEVSVMTMKAEVTTIAFWRAVIAECLASLLHVLFGCLATLTCSGSPSRDDLHVLVVALCFGLTVASLVQGFQHISGAHLNPVVSLVHVLTRQVTPFRAVMYTVAQTGGAVAGASILHGITSGSCQAGLGVTTVARGLSVWQGLGVEILLTFLLVFTVCATNDPNRNELSNKALVIGLAVAGCHLAGYRFTGSSMNPARSLGPAFVASNWTSHWIYWAGPTLGGVAAGLLYEFIFDPSRTRSRSQPPASFDAEEGLATATTSLTTANPAHLPLSNTTPATTNRHYYNSTPTLGNHGSHNNSSNALLGSPRSCRRDGNTATTATTTTTATNNNSNNLSHISASTTTPNHYVPGTYGERALIDIGRDVRSPSDVMTPPLTAPPVPRRNDASSRRGGETMTYGRRQTGGDDVLTPGRENQAYAFDSNPRRLQSPSSHPPPAILNLFGDDGRETICLSDVRVF